MKHGRLLSVSERWFRLLLRLYPADFRDEMGEALVETYLHRSRKESFALVWCAALWDSLRNGIGERLRPAVAWRRAGDWGRDMELVSRRFRQKPLFLASVLATLTVGLGTFAVVYTAVDKILIEPLPYKNPSDLYMIWGNQSKDLPHLMLTGPEVAELQKAGGVIEDAAGMQFGGVTLLGDDDKEAMRLSVMVCSANLFDLLGVQPALGRGFRPDEARTNRPNVIVLSDEMWRRLGGNPAIVGTNLRLGTALYTVIGVMPRDFLFSAISSQKLDAYIPFAFALASVNPKNTNFQALIRARAGASPEEIRQAVDAVGRFVDRRDLGWGRTIFPLGLQAEMVNEVRPALLALGFAGIFLVLVLMVNLASLLLARATEREREFAVSRALGGSAPAVVRATVIEGGLLGLVGGITGALIGTWGTRLLVTLGPVDLPRRDSIALDWNVAAVVIAVGFLLGLIAAAVPAIWAARVSLAALLSTSAVRGGAGSSRMRRGLIVVQVALSLVLLSTGGLVVRSFERLLVADPGFRPEGVLTFNLGLFGGVFPKNAEVYAFLDQLDAALRAVPGVIGVSTTTELPLSGGIKGDFVEVPGAPGNSGDRERDRRTVRHIFTRAGYIKTLGIRLVEGREFEATDRGAGREVMIDRALARHFFPNGSPIGATLKGEGGAMTIVGVFEQARLRYLYKDDDNPHIFVRADEYETGSRPTYYVVRTEMDPLSLLPEVRAAIRRIDRRITISNVRTMDEIVADARSKERVSAILIAGLALGALLLVAMGLFGVISGSVARRRGELAVRMALGATHGRVIRLVVGEGARLVALGLVIGIPGVDMAGEAIRGLLIDVSPFDVPTIITVTIGLIVVSLLACYLAARRVTAIEPERLLREG